MEEINDDLKLALKRFKNFKEGKILEHAYKSAKFSINKDLVEHILDPEDLKNMINRQLINTISELISKDLENTMVVNNSNPNYDSAYEVEFFAFSPADFKSIVEYCVRTMPISAINKIREIK